MRRAYVCSRGGLVAATTETSGFRDEFVAASGSIPPERIKEMTMDFPQGDLRLLKTDIAQRLLH